MELAAEVALPAAKEIGAAYETASRQIVASPSFKTYLDAPDALIDYIPFPDALSGKYQCFTQADLSALRAATSSRLVAQISASLSVILQ